MFNEYYGFTHLPFSKTIATGDLFATAGQKELAARLNYLVRERGFGLVTGEIGSGKSTAVRAFTASLDPNRYLVLYLANPTTGISGVYRDLLLGLGHEPPFSRPRLVARLREAFTDLLNAKRRVPIVILDEAHLLTQPMLEQLRLLFADQMREAASPWPPWFWSAIRICAGHCTWLYTKPLASGSLCGITSGRWIWPRRWATFGTMCASLATPPAHCSLMTPLPVSLSSPRVCREESIRSAPPRSWPVSSTRSCSWTRPLSARPSSSLIATR